MDKRDRPPYKKKTVYGIKKTLSDLYYSLEDYLKQTVNSLSPIYQFQTHHLRESRETIFRQDHREVSVYFTTTR